MLKNQSSAQDDNVLIPTAIVGNLMQKSLMTILG
jgi:hypothetical protein